MRYVPDRAGVGKLLLGADMAKVMLAAAERGAAYAVSIAPTDSGEYADSFTADVEVQGDRQTGVVANTAEHAGWVEWGTSNQAGHHVLARTADYLDERRRR